jgi:hypothetical protein
MPDFPYNPRDMSFSVATDLFVKKWTANVNGFAIAGPGVPAQGNDEPTSHFTNHMIVKYAGRYYDPSCGCTIDTDIQWENDALDAFGVEAIVAYSGPLGVKIFRKVVIWKKDPKGTLESDFKPINY